MVIRDIEEVLRMPVEFTLPEAEAEIVEATHKAVALEETLRSRATWNSSRGG